MRLGVPLIPVRAAARSTSDSIVGSATTRLATRPGCCSAVQSILVVALLVAAWSASLRSPERRRSPLLVPAAVVDVEQRRLPDAWVGAGADLVGRRAGRELRASASRSKAACSTSSASERSPWRCRCWCSHLVSPSSMGFGDVKAALVLGAAVGTVDWRLAVVALCLAARAALRSRALDPATNRPLRPVPGPRSRRSSSLAHGPIGTVHSSTARCAP